MRLRLAFVDAKQRVGSAVAGRKGSRWAWKSGSGGSLGAVLARADGLREAGTGATSTASLVTTASRGLDARRAGASPSLAHGAAGPGPTGAAAHTAAAPSVAALNPAAHAAAHASTAHTSTARSPAAHAAVAATAAATGPSEASLADPGAAVCACDVADHRYRRTGAWFRQKASVSIPTEPHLAM